MGGGMLGCSRRSIGRWAWDRAAGGAGATAGAVIRAVVAGDIPGADKAEVRARGRDKVAASSPAKIIGRFRRTTSDFSTRCWIRSGPSFRWIRRESMRLDFQRADS